jgi:hypothetical protein
LDIAAGFLDAAVSFSEFEFGTRVHQLALYLVKTALSPFAMASWPHKDAAITFCN